MKQMDNKKDIGRERCEKYKSYKEVFQINITKTRTRSYCRFKLCGKPLHDRGGWIVKLLCQNYNYELIDMLVGLYFVNT